MARQNFAGNRLRLMKRECASLVCECLLEGRSYRAPSPADLAICVETSYSDCSIGLDLVAEFGLACARFPGVF